MTKLINKITALGLSVLCLSSFAGANEGKTVYLNIDSNKIVENISDLYNKTSDEGSSTFVTSSKYLVDSLVGGVLVAETDSKHFYDNASDALDFNNVSVIGGPNSVEHGLDENRIYGATRYDTAVQVAKDLGVDRNIVICSGESFVDALPATSLAAYENRNILLVEENFIPQITENYLKEYGKDKDILVIGGDKVISEELVAELSQLTDGSSIERISGSDRYDTSLKISARFNDYQGLVVSDDKLSEESFLASIYAAKNGYPVLMINLETGRGVDNIGSFNPNKLYLLSSHNEDLYDFISDEVTIRDLAGNPIDKTSLYGDDLGLSSVESVEVEVEGQDEIKEEKKAYKQTGSEAEAKEWIAQRESNGSYTAYNPNGGYYGRYQLNPSLIHYGASPEEQEAAADAYVYARYGSWTQAQSFWMANGWY